MDIIDPEKYGISFSLKQCRGFKLNAESSTDWLLHAAGFRRFRLMSYWDEHEKQPGEYDFTELDWQVKKVAEAGGVISLCLGARQPRWPENHWPEWAWNSSKPERSTALLEYIKQVVERYKDEPAIISYQLENEALLKAFGRRPEVDRRRLREEYDLIKRLDPHTPIIMTTSTHWGIPLRRPIPDKVGFSYYTTYYNKKHRDFRTTGHFDWLHRARAKAIRGIWHRPTFVHELQVEPWASDAIWKVTNAEQDESMGPTRIAHQLRLAQKTKLYPIDMWGAEWWYWRHTQGDDSVWRAVKQAIHS